MPRSSRHKSHRSQKHRDRSASVEEENLKVRGRSSSDLEPAKVLARDLEVKDWNAEVENGKKGKDREMEVSGMSDRWNGDAHGRHAGGVEVKRDKIVGLDVEKNEKVKVSSLSADSKSMSGRTHDDSTGWKEDGGVRDAAAKRRFEKESFRRETGNQNLGERERDSGKSLNEDSELAAERSKEYGSVKDRGRESEKDREYALERDRDRERRSKSDRERVLDSGRERDIVRDSPRERFSGVANRKSEIGSTEGKYLMKGELENTEWKIQGELLNPGVEKDLPKPFRRDSSAEKDKWQGNARDSDNKKFYSPDHGTDGNIKDEKYKDGRYREKIRDDSNRGQRHRDDRHCDDRPTGHHNSASSENKNQRNEFKHLEIRSDTGLGDCDREGSQNIDEHHLKYKDKGNKRSFDEKEEHSDLKFTNLSRAVQEQKVLNNHNLVLDDERGRSESVNIGKVDSMIRRKLPRNSPTSSFHVVKDEYRQSTTVHSRSMSKERHHTSSASSGEFATVSGATERALKSRSVESRATEKDLMHSDDMQVEDAAASSQCERTRLDDNASPASRDQQYSKRKTASHSSDADNLQTRIHPREGKETTIDDNSQITLPNNGLSRSGSSSINRTDHFPTSSPRHLPTPVRHGVDGSSVLGSFEDNSRVQSADRKSNNRYKRTMDSNMGRGQGNAWRGITNWPSNGFIPFQHGPSPTGFHPVMQHFPSPTMFGVRPFMDINHRGVPFHMHETPEQFSTHGLPFGWRNPSDDSCPPHFQGWDGTSSVYGDDSRVYGRLDWEQNTHLISNRGWEMNTDPSKEQKESVKCEIFASRTESGHSTRSQVDEARLEHAVHLPQYEEQNEFKQLSDIDLKQYVGTSAKANVETPIVKRQKTSELAKLPNDDGPSFCGVYLSKLDISLDLAHTELYRKCTSIACTGTAISAASTTYLNSEDFNEGIKVAVRGSKQARKPLFPLITDDVFKKAIFLYKKVTDGSKAKLLSSFLEEKEEESPKTLKEEKTKLIESCSSAEDVSLANADTPCKMEEDSNEGCDVVDLLGNSLDKPSATIPNAVVFAEESSQGCEDLIPECLSRIHNSPESTH